jgi:predicted Zn-dependent protease with MMP-like domain
MALKKKQQVELRTNLARDKAEALLQGLLDAKAIAEADKERLAGMTPEQLALGRQAMDNAIASAQRMLENLEAALKIARRGEA